MSQVVIVCCYRSGTQKMLETCASAIVRHTTDVDYNFLIVTRDAKAKELDDIIDMFPDGRASMFKPRVKEGPRVHGEMLDATVEMLLLRRKSPFLLTLDSDCFPVADRWLSGLFWELAMPMTGAAGILHPWAPPPSDMLKTKIEWRVRSQHCWLSTHVACQLVSIPMLNYLGAKYAVGDDTGLDVVKRIKEIGWRCTGYGPTRCPRSRTSFNPEFNRYVGVIYGNAVYHHGGFTRTAVGGDSALMEKSFGWAMKKVLKKKGAEWLLDDSVSYKYALDREEEVAAEKMQRLFGLKDQVMKE